MYRDNGFYYILIHRVNHWSVYLLKQSSSKRSDRKDMHNPYTTLTQKVKSGLPTRIGKTFRELPETWITSVRFINNRRRHSDFHFIWRIAKELSKERDKLLFGNNDHWILNDCRNTRR